MNTKMPDRQLDGKEKSEYQRFEPAGGEITEQAVCEDELRNGLRHKEMNDNS